MAKCTSECFSYHSSDDLRAKVEPSSCRQYKPGDFLAVRLLNWDEVIDKDDDDKNSADPGELSGGCSCPGNGNNNDDGEGEEDKNGGEKATGQGKGTKDGLGKWKATEDRKGKRRGRGGEMVKGNVLLY